MPAAHCSAAQSRRPSRFTHRAPTPFLWSMRTHAGLRRRLHGQHRRLVGKSSLRAGGTTAAGRFPRISSNYHAPQPNGSAVLMIAARGVVLDGNNNGDHLSPDQTTPLIRVGPSAPTAALRSKLWNVSDVTCRGNAAFPGLVRALRPGEPLPAGQRDAFAGCV